MRAPGSLLSIATSVLVAAINVNGCAYTREMAKAEANRSAMNQELALTNAAVQSKQSKTPALQDERDGLRRTLAAHKRTLSSLEVRREKLAMVPAAHRTSGEQVKLAQIQSQIDQARRQIDEKENRLKYLNEKL